MLQGAVQQTAKIKLQNNGESQDSGKQGTYGVYHNIHYHNNR